jgi:2,3-dihydroxyphenylpropionate 1,2-dioxygenase
MTEIIFGVGASHSTLMNTHWDATIHLDRAERFRDALDNARSQLALTRPDVVVLIGSNHFRGLWLDLIPSFTIGLGECIASGESGTPKGQQPVDEQLARYIADTVIEHDGFDVAFSARLQIDHGQSHAIQYLMRSLDVPIVPIVINVFAPPLPTLSRCEALGFAIRAAIMSFPGSRRVAVIGSGGLSHRLPWPDWRHPNGADEEFMLAAWLNGRSDWESYDARRRRIITEAKAAINAEFDDRLLALLEAGELHRLTAYTSDQLQDEAGNGAQEVRTWLMMSAILGHAAGRRLAYEQIPEWLTGMAVAVIKPAEQGELEVAV